MYVLNILERIAPKLAPLSVPISACGNSILHVAQARDCYSPWIPPWFFSHTTSKPPANPMGYTFKIHPEFNCYHYKIWATISSLIISKISWIIFLLPPCLISNCAQSSRFVSKNTGQYRLFLPSMLQLTLKLYLTILPLIHSVSPSLPPSHSWNIPGVLSSQDIRVCFLCQEC